MGTRVAVMKNGRLLQCSAPQDLYDKPANVFVAGFIGSPKMNLFRSRITRGANGDLSFAFGPQTIAISPEFAARTSGLKEQVDKPVSIGIRPEGFVLTTESGPETIEAKAEVVEMLGSETLVFFVAPVDQASDADVRDRAQATDEEESILAGEGTTVMCARLVPPLRLAPGAGLRLRIDPNQLYVFDEAGDAIG